MYFKTIKHLNSVIHANPLNTETALIQADSVLFLMPLLTGFGCSFFLANFCFFLTNQLFNLHPVVDENLVHNLLYFVKLWSFIRVLNPTLFHEFPDLLKTSYQCCNRRAECWELAFFHSIDNVYRIKNVQLLKPYISHLMQTFYLTYKSTIASV